MDTEEAVKVGEASFAQGFERGLFLRLTLGLGKELLEGETD